MREDRAEGPMRGSGCKYTARAKFCQVISSAVRWAMGLVVLLAVSAGLLLLEAVVRVGA